MPKGMKHQARFTKHQVTGHVTCFFQGCVFPHPEPKKFRGTACSSFPQKFPLFPLIRGKKGVILGRDKKISSPGSPCTTLNTSIRFVQAFRQSSSFSLYIAVEVAFTLSLLSRISIRAGPAKRLIICQPGLTLPFLRVWA